MMKETPRASLREVAWIFFRLGSIGFGGPVATMAMMEEECQRRRKWMTAQEYAEMYAITKLLPGPVAAQLAIFIGKHRAGFLGGLIAGVLFVLPSFLMVLGLSYLYVRTGKFGGASGLMSGLQIGALVVILLSVEQMSRTYRKLPAAWVIVALSGGLIFFLPRWEPLVILVCGLLGAWKAVRESRTGDSTRTLSAGGADRVQAFWAVPAAGAVSVVSMSTLGQLFWTCFKAGAFVFGTGLAIVPLLEADAVGVHSWITHEQFMDGLAIGQITPGPVVITVVFIGYLTSGWLGSLAATAGMFLPAFINVLFLVPILWGKWSGSPSSKGFSAWAIPAVIGGILGTTVKLGLTTLIAPWQIGLFVAAIAIAAWRRPPAWVLIPLTGAAAFFIGWI